MKKTLIAVLIFLVLIISSGFVSKTETVLEDNGDFNLYFCPQDNCETNFLNFLNSAEESIHCALFEVGLNSVKDKLLEKSKQMDVKVVIDDRYSFNQPFVKKDKWGLMHNKFCIIDGKKISTGSMNPTNNGVNKNNNNLLLLESKTLAKNYETEFQELWNEEFKGGLPTNVPEFLFNNVSVKNYFCPEDYCADKIKTELKKAEVSIHFMTFSFTHEGIANMLLLKHLDGIQIKGVMEARQVSKYSQYNRLKYNGLDVVKDQNKQNMHHNVLRIATIL